MRNLRLVMLPPSVSRPVKPKAKNVEWEEPVVL